PSAEDTQHSDYAVDGNDVSPAMFDVEAAGLLEEIGQPNEEKPPYRVSEELSDDKGPGFTITQQFNPGGFLLSLFVFLIAVDMLEFGHIDSGGLSGKAIEGDP